MNYIKIHKKSAAVMIIAGIICAWSGYRIIHPKQDDIDEEEQEKQE